MVAIERFYKLDDVTLSEDKQELCWHKGIKMSAEYALEALRVKKEYFYCLYRFHGVQTSNMILSGLILLPECAYLKEPCDIDLVELAKTAAVTYSTLIRRYNDGLRGDELVAPRSKTRNNNKKVDV